MNELGSLTQLVSRYPKEAHSILREMQERHFWYRGRRRFVLRGLEHVVKKIGRFGDILNVADLGGGNGNWLAYLLAQSRIQFGRVVLADSSEAALTDAQKIVPHEVECRCIDLGLALPWNREFDIVFLLDVIEHFLDDKALLLRVGNALRPGGLLVVTVPAMPALWSWNDEAAGHFRRYRLRDLGALAEATGFEPLLLRYFNFLLSPLYVVARVLCRPKNEHEMHDAVLRFHRVPPAWLNKVLGAIFCAETPLGLVVPFPWGTSALLVARLC